MEWVCSGVWRCVVVCGGVCGKVVEGQRYVCGVGVEVVVCGGV